VASIYDINKNFDPKGASVNIPWEPATSYQSPYGTSPDFSGYWNPKGDSAGYDWNQATKWNPSKDFLSNFLGKSGLGGKSYSGYGGQDEQSRGSWFGGASSGFSGGNLLPGFSAVQPESAKIVGQAAGVQGTPGFGEQLLGIGAGVLGAAAGSFLGPIGAAAGGSIAKSLFPA
jgi:hypothetical protein